MQTQDQAVHFIDQLLGVGICTQMTGFDCLQGAAVQGFLPGAHHGDQLFADFTGTIVVLDRAADIDATGGDFNRHLPDPAPKHGFQAWQAACFLDTRIKYFLFELAVVQLHHFDLQVFTRTEMGKHAGLAHVHFFGQQADRQTFKAVAARQRDGDVENRCARQFAFTHEFRRHVSMCHDSPTSVWLSLANEPG